MHLYYKAKAKRLLWWRRAQFSAEIRVSFACGRIDGPLGWTNFSLDFLFAWRPLGNSHFRRANQHFLRSIRRSTGEHIDQTMAMWSPLPMVLIPCIIIQIAIVFRAVAVVLQIIIAARRSRMIWITNGIRVVVQWAPGVLAVGVFVWRWFVSVFKNVTANCQITENQ